MSAEHPHNKTTFSLVRLILNMALAAFNSGVFVSHVTQAALEDGEERLLNFRRTLENLEIRVSILCCTVDM